MDVFWTSRRVMKEEELELHETEKKVEAEPK